MKKHHLLGVILLCSGLFSCSSGVIQQANYEVIPLPQEIKITTGSFVLNDRTSIVYPKDNKEMQQNANLLAKYIHQMSGKKLKVIDEPVTSNAIILATGLNADNAEAYQLKVTQDNVTITGDTIVYIYILGNSFLCCSHKLKLNTAFNTFFFHML